MINALVLYRSINWLGGVVTFSEALKRHIDADIIINHFLIGRRDCTDTRISAIKTTFRDCINLYNLLENNKFDIVHLNPSLTLNSLLREIAFLSILKLKKQHNIVVFFHGLDKHLSNLLDSSYTLRRLFFSIFGHVSYFFVLSDSLMHLLLTIGIQKVKIEKITTMFEGSIFINSRKFSSDGLTRLLFLSRFVKEKGVYELLEAFSMLSKEFLGLRLICAGDGPEREGMKKWVHIHGLGDVVDFPGYLRGEDKARALMESDLFILPSYGEGCPVALLEAMAAGLAVVCTSVGGIPDVVKNGVNGILIDRASPEAIAAAVRELLSNAKLMAEMQDRNTENAWSKYEAKVVSARIGSIYKMLAVERVHIG